MKKDYCTMFNSRNGSSNAAPSEGELSPHRSTQSPKEIVDTTFDTQESRFASRTHETISFQSLTLQQEEQEHGNSTALPYLREAARPQHSSFDFRNQSEIQLRCVFGDSLVDSCPPEAAMTDESSSSSSSSSSSTLSMPAMVRKVSLEPAVIPPSTCFQPAVTVARPKRRRNSSIQLEPMEEDSPLITQSGKRRRLHERKQAMLPSDFDSIFGQIGRIDGL